MNKRIKKKKLLAVGYSIKKEYNAYNRKNGCRTIVAIKFKKIGMSYEALYSYRNAIHINGKLFSSKSNKLFIVSNTRLGHILKNVDTKEEGLIIPPHKPPKRKKPTKPTK